MEMMRRLPEINLSIRSWIIGEAFTGLRNPWRDIEDAQALVKRPDLVVKYHYIVGITRAIEAAAKGAPAGTLLSPAAIRPHLKCPTAGTARQKAAYVDAMAVLLDRCAKRVRVLD